MYPHSRWLAGAVTVGSLVFGLLCLTGCGAAGTAKARIHGKVTFDGQKVSTGSIRFVPVDGKSPTAGSPIKDGTYSAEVPLGSMRVEINSPKVVGHKKTYAGDPNSPTQDITKELIPPQYNSASKLVKDIKGDEEIDFILTKK